MPARCSLDEIQTDSIRNCWIGLIAYEHTCTHCYYMDREGIPISWLGLELSHGPWLHWERSFLDAFPCTMARLGTTGRKRYPSVVLVLEHRGKRSHVYLLYFPTRSDWDSRVSS